MSKTNPDDELWARALQFAQRGWAVFPLAPNSKIPHKGSGGFKDATTDAETIRQAWQTFPMSNIGIATGKPSKVFVVDVDRDAKKKLDGMAELKRLEKTHSELPQTFTVATPRGGRHLFFQMPDSNAVKSGTDVLARGIDVRGDGGYVVAPGSKVDGRAYRIVNASPPAVPPLWLVELVRKEAAPTPADKPPQTAAPLTDESRIREALKFIPADAYESWVQVGMALHHWNTSRGFSVWNEWSQTCPDKYDPGVLTSKWRSFQANGAITEGTLFLLAKQGGWLPPRAETNGDREPRSGTDAELVAIYGEPVFLRGGEHGGIASINERFFAARLHREGRILFEPGERAFYIYNPGSGLWQRVSDDHVRENLSSHIVEYRPNGWF